VVVMVMMVAAAAAAAAAAVVVVNFGAVVRSYTPCCGTAITHCAYVVCYFRDVLNPFIYFIIAMYVSQKKQDTKLLPITSPNVNRFSNFFHWQTHW